MNDLNDRYFYKIFRTSLGLSVLVVLAFMLSVAAAQAGGKGGGKGGGSGGGGDSGGGPQPELHLKWRVLIKDYYSLVRPVLAADGTIISSGRHLMRAQKESMWARTALYIQATKIISRRSILMVGPSGHSYQTYAPMPCMMSLWGQTAISMV